MRKVLFGFLLLFLGCSSFAQVDSISLKAAIQKLDAALIQKNATDLEAILEKDLSFGHSSGWVQSKSDVLNDFKSGKLAYNKIDNNSSAILSINNQYATVQTNTNVEGVLNGAAFKVKLHVLLVWIKSKNGWQLVARQAARIS